MPRRKAPLIAEPSPPTDPRAQALLDAHVAWQLEQLQGAALEQALGAQLDRALAVFTQLKLKDVVRAGDVRAVALKYTADIRIGGLIPELSGQVARELYNYGMRSQTRLEELCSDAQFEELLDKLLELRTLRETLARQSVSNPIFAGLVAELLHTGIRDYLRRGEEASARVPGARSALKLGRRVVERARPDLGQVLDEGLRTFVQKQTQASLRVSERFLLEAIEGEELRRALRELWDEHKHRSLASIGRFASGLDIEELFVIGYEYWQDLRQNPLFAELLGRGVDEVYAQLAPLTLAEILERIGLSREMMLEDALRFAPPVIKALQRRKLLEPLVRAQLAGFYSSAACAQALQVAPES